MQYSQLTDKALKQRLEHEWQALNDYVGMACYQLGNDQPFWRTLMDSLSADPLAQWFASPRFDDKRLQQDGEFAGFWAGNVFISRRQGAAPVLQLFWRDAQNQNPTGVYLYSGRQYRACTATSHIAHPAAERRDPFRAQRFRCAASVVGA